MSTEPTTEAGKALGQRLARYYPPEEFEDWDAWVAKAEAEAREQGAAAERGRLRRIGPERLSAALAVMPASYTIQTWATGGTGDAEPPWDAPVHEVFPVSAFVDALLAALLTDPEP